ncbi:MAG: anti-sigma regulatory factor [Bacteroidetes bacterium]|nr:MAG: anti-sigma regulatory factor [Bacteroidota bacterium]
MTDPIENRNWTRLDKQTIQAEMDVVKVRQLVRYHAKEIGLGIVDQTRITTAASELFRNMFLYAEGGDVLMDAGIYNDHKAFIITCIDRGPGIEDIEMAMKDGYSTGDGMGYGLPGSKRLVDDFYIESTVNQGTTVRIMKWI